MRPLNVPKIDLRNKPMLLPAAAFAAGTLLAFQVSYLSIPLLAALGLAGRLPAAELAGSRERLVRQTLRRKLGLPVLSLFSPEAQRA